MSRRIVSIAQMVYATILCALIAARLPSFGEEEVPTFSYHGAIVGAVIALVAFGVSSVALPLAQIAEKKWLPIQITLMRGAVICLVMAMTFFTIFIYFNQVWLLYLIGGAGFFGGACIIGGNMVIWFGRKN